MEQDNMGPQGRRYWRYLHGLSLRMSRQGIWWVICYYVNRIHIMLRALVHFHRTDVYIDFSSRISGTKYMHIGRCFHAGRGLWMEAIDLYGQGDGEQQFTPELVIGDNVSLSEYVHIGCVNRVIIGNNVLMGSKIYITDHNHGVYSGPHQDSPNVPPTQRPLTEGKAVIIEDNVWIGEFVTVLPGVTIGYGSIIGTHSTVTHDIPPQCIAVGSPARVIKRWNEATQTWDRVAKN